MEGRREKEGGGDRGRRDGLIAGHMYSGRISVTRVPVQEESLEKKSWRM